MEKYSKAWTDDDILEALWMRDEGYTFKQIGARFVRNKERGDRSSAQSNEGKRMIYWHILVLTYTFETQTFESTIAFRDQSSGMLPNAMDEIYPTILAAYSDSMAQCQPTDTVSGWTIRPKARPVR